MRGKQGMVDKDAGKNVLVPVERLKEWSAGCAREAVRYPLDSREREFLWDMAYIIDLEAKGA